MWGWEGRKDGISFILDKNLRWGTSTWKFLASGLKKGSELRAKKYICAYNAYI